MSAWYFGETVIQVIGERTASVNHTTAAAINHVLSASLSQPTLTTELHANLATNIEVEELEADVCD